MLRLQGECALLQRHIDSAGHAVLQVAIDATSPQAYAVDGQRIALRPVHLTVGGEDTAHQGPSTLAGLTFIVEQNSGLTLLYLPDSTDALFLRQYESLEQARVDLFRRCVDSNMVNYLAGRAVGGDFASHVSRINQAQLRNFDALIGVGMAWPATTSLAIHLLNAHGPVAGGPSQQFAFQRCVVSGTLRTEIRGIVQLPENGHRHGAVRGYGSGPV
jgi:hypothetical protein